LESNQVGLHLRINTDLVALFRDAQDLAIPHFQFFLTNPKNQNKYITLSDEEKSTLSALRNHFKGVFIHSSYWINPATGSEKSYEVSKSLLIQEMTLASQLQASAIVLHPGSAKGYPEHENESTSRNLGIHTAAKLLNEVMEKIPDIKILLENTAHGNKAIGSKLEDLAAIKSLIDKQDRVGFCLDTAHAHAYGYNMHKVDDFIREVGKTLGFANIHLIHLNDSIEPMGSKKDQHAPPGQGLIGKEPFKSIFQHPELALIPKIVECSLFDLNQAKKIILETKNI
jgi:deoxyribonuclease-4